MTSKNNNPSSSCSLGCLIPILLVIFIWSFFSSDSDSDSNNGSEAYAMTLCEREIKKKLLSPSSAKIEYSKKEQIGSSFYFSGYVEAKNAFGVMIPEDFSAKIEYNSNNETYSIVQFNFGSINYRKKSVVQSQKTSPTISTNKESENGESDYELGLSYMLGANENSPDPQKAFMHFHTGALKGNEKAKYQLAQCYAAGYGTLQNYDEAVNWYRDIAEKGDHYAQQHLAWCYITGKGVRQSYSRGIEWLQKAADRKRNTDAIFGLGAMYETGKGVQQDYSEAVKWYRIAAAGIGHNLSEAQFFLGECYNKGLGVSQNKNEAIRWWKEAAMQSHFGAESRLNKGIPGYPVVFSADEEKEEYSKNDIPLRKATDLGGPFVQYVMINFYYHLSLLENNPKPDYSEAIAWLREEATLDNSDAQFVLGKCYEYGDVIEKNEEEALKWYCRAAALGNDNAANEPAFIQFQQEEELRKEHEKAEKEKKNASDEDLDGFTFAQETANQTDPANPLSHPKYITQVHVSNVSRQRFNGLELFSVDTSKRDKKEWIAEFNVTRNNKKTIAIIRINGKFKTGDTEFSIVDIEQEKKTRESIVYIQRIGKNERIPCRLKQAVYDPVYRVQLVDELNNHEFSSAVGSTFKLGDAKTGEEQYKIVSADLETKTVIVESTEGNKTKYTLQSKK